jgi:hypothetical protein
VSRESTTPDLVELAQRAVDAMNARDIGAVSTVVDGLGERITNYLDIDQARAAAERLAQERR